MQQVDFWQSAIVDLVWQSLFYAQPIVHLRTVP
jgi:hypothetical protein